MFEQKTNVSSKLKATGKFTRNLLLVSMLGLPLFTQAQAPTHTSEISAVNSNPGAQRIHDVHVLANGNYVVTWLGGGVVAYEQAQTFDSNGNKLGPEISLNTGGQIIPLENGSFLVIDFENRYSFNQSNVSIQKYTSSGMADSSSYKLPLSTTVASADDTFKEFKVTKLSNNKLAIAFGTENIYTKIINIGSTITAQDAVKTSAVASGYKPDINVTTLENGDFIVTWVGRLSAQNDKPIYFQRYNNQGQAIGENKVLNSLHKDIYVPDIGIDATKNGGFIMTWPSTVDNSTYNLLGQTFSADGQSQSVPFQINTDPMRVRDAQSDVSVTANGDFLVTWSQTSSQNYDTNIYLQAINADGTKSGDKVLVDTNTTLYEPLPMIGDLQAGNFVLVWVANIYSAADTPEVLSQHFTLSSPQLPNELTATVPSGPIYVGDTIELPLSATGTNIYGIDSVLTVNNSNIAQVTGGSYGEFLPTGQRLTIPVNHTDSSWESALSLKAPYEAKTGQGQYATVTLVANNPGSTSVSLSSQFTNENGQYIYQGQYNYTLTVLESVFLTGDVSSLQSNGDYSQITITINGEPVQINADGTFKIRADIGNATVVISAPGFISGEKQLTLSPNQADLDFGPVQLTAGDSNGNEKIDIGDLTQLLASYRSTSAEPNYTPSADFNRDNKIDLQDLTLLGKNFGKQGPQPF
ncbi:hypothetical protein L1077_18315 [Pseudoalteromonas luteoviolacea]|uniref:dockerin type I domain-containing protein n=1 Tax=Pseudoalteromonas luteoviolacea TaxID=43657 RepID=UPI001F411E7C|nr:dockerin type I domain-containing protein [Pseudoalteromonas luteoviolacea]MCF6441394.1 hypothetical protein [Pseudoalteromonas luteoviolacea]